MLGTRAPLRTCVQSVALYPADPQLHPKLQHQPLHQVSRRHNSSGAHQQQGPERPQERSETAGHVVQREQFLLNCKKKERKKIDINFWRAHTQQLPLVINGSAVERVSSTRFLGVHIKASPRQTTTSLAKKAKQATSLLLPHTKKTESLGTHHAQRH